MPFLFSRAKTTFTPSGATLSFCPPETKGETSVRTNTSPAIRFFFRASTLFPPFPMTVREIHSHMRKKEPNANANIYYTFLALQKKKRKEKKRASPRIPPWDPTPFVILPLAFQIPLFPRLAPELARALRVLGGFTAVHEGVLRPLVAHVRPIKNREVSNC